MPKDIISEILKALDARLPSHTHRNEQGKAKLAEFLSTIYRTGLTNLGQSKKELQLQELADEIYAACFNEQMPYRMFYTLGNTDNLFQAVHIYETVDVTKPKTLDTLCHELLHVHDMFRPHGKRFQAKVDKMLKVTHDILTR